MKRIKVGDVLEIPMGDGYAYAQLSHREPLMGDLIRVFEDISPTPRADWAALVQQRPLFLTFFYISHGVEPVRSKIVGNAPIPEEARAFRSSCARACRMTRRESRQRGGHGTAIRAASSTRSRLSSRGCPFARGSTKCSSRSGFARSGTTRTA